MALSTLLAAVLASVCVHSEGNTPETKRIASAVCDQSQSFVTVSLHDFTEHLGVVQFEGKLPAERLRLEMDPENRDETTEGYTSLLRTMLETFPEAPEARITVLLFRLGEETVRMSFALKRGEDEAPEVFFGTAP